MSTAIVTTTIRRPSVLEEYAANLATFGHRDVEFIVIGDRKTPDDVGDYLRRLAADSAYAIDYWDVARQRQLLRTLPALDRLLPYDSVQRRNLGYLVAAEAAHERIISIDDDNWPTGEDYLSGHQIVGAVAALPAVAADTGWFNSAGLLDVVPQKPLYHRGFPTSMRNTATKLSHSTMRGRVVVNAGLWVGTPDADAMGHLDSPTTVTGLRSGTPSHLAVAHGTNLVFNTQNTAFHRDLLPCMFLPPMGSRIGSLQVGRHDDVWMGMILKIIADHLGDVVCVGKPLTEQRRNQHDLFADALLELPALRLTNRLVDTLGAAVATGSDYLSCYLALVEDLRVLTAHYPTEEASFVAELLDRMAAWGEITAGLPLLPRS